MAKQDLTPTITVGHNEVEVVFGNFSARCVDDVVTFTLPAVYPMYNCNAVLSDAYGQSIASFCGKGWANLEQLMRAHDCNTVSDLLCDALRRLEADFVGLVANDLKNCYKPLVETEGPDGDVVVHFGNFIATQGQYGTIVTGPRDFDTKEQVKLALRDIVSARDPLSGIWFKTGVGTAALLTDLLAHLQLRYNTFVQDRAVAFYEGDRK